jgi:hypothetical protein
MKTRKMRSRVDIRSRRQETTEPITYQEIADGLVSEMAGLLLPAESGKFSPPLELVILDNRGCVAFTGQADRDGKMQAAGPVRRLRRSHFPANAWITDRSLATRTFRIDRVAPRGMCR